MKKVKIFIDGLSTGLMLQFAIGPVFFFLINLSLQRTIYDGFSGVVAVTLVDYFYITLAILGVGKLLENKKVKKSFGVVSSIVLIIFGILMGNKILLGSAMFNTLLINSTSLFSSFTSVFFLTISSPMTIVFFTSLFASKAVERNYSKKELFVFGFSTGFATLLFLGSSVILFSIIKESIPLQFIQISNLIVGILLISYGGLRLVKMLSYQAIKP